MIYQSLWGKLVFNLISLYDEKNKAKEKEIYDLKKQIVEFKFSLESKEEELQIISKELEFFKNKSNESSRNLDKLSEENKSLKESVCSMQSNIDKIDRLAYGKLIKK